MLSFFSCFKIEIKPLSSKPIFLKKKNSFLKSILKNPKKDIYFCPNQEIQGKFQIFFFCVFKQKYQYLYFCLNSLTGKGGTTPTFCFSHGILKVKRLAHNIFFPINMCTQ